MILAILAGAWLLGVVAGAVAGEVWWPGATAIGVGGLAATLLYRQPQLALLGLASTGLFIAGAIRYVEERPSDEPSGVALYNDTADARFRAVVVDEPAIRGRSQRVRLSVREVLDNGRWQTSFGGVLLRTSPFPRYRYGDFLEVEGGLETPPSFPEFDYREYLARRGVGSVIEFPEVRALDSGRGNDALAAVHGLRRRLGDALERALPEPQAALAQGIFLGQRSAIPQDLTADMNATGTSHLVAISGHNVSLVAALVMGSLAWLVGRRQAALVALVVIAGYTVLTGASPTVVRAAIMGGLFLVATLVGRPSSAPTSIALAAALMTAWDPLVVQDVSFQLSFAAILGLVYLSPALQERGAGLLRTVGIDPTVGIGSSVLETSAMTVGAVAATLPLIALNFGRISPVALISNLLLVPAFPFILGTSALAAATGAVWPPLGQATGWFAWFFLTYMIELARFFARLPLASFEIAGFGAGHAAGFYLLLAAFAWWLAQARAGAPRAEPERFPTIALSVRPAWALAGTLAVAASLVWWAVLDDGGGRLTLTVLDVGQGDALLVESPEGHRILIDGGPNGRALTEALSRELPFWERKIDMVVLTHPQEDHLTGLIEALDRYDVGQVLASPLSAETAAYREWRDLIRREDIPYRAGRPGQRIDLGGGATLEVLGPGTAALASREPNDASLVLKLTWGDVSFLLTGDIEAPGEEALLSSNADLRSTVLKVSHHGSVTSTSDPFVRAVRPEVAVVSVGEGNLFGHPAGSVLRRLDAIVLRTDRHGSVRIETDGERLWVSPERTSAE